MHRLAALTLMLAACGIGYAHAGPQYNFQPLYAKPVFRPGPPPCLACSAQLQPNTGLTVNPQINKPAIGLNGSAAPRIR